jgi:predicted nucleic acid-binding protein
MAFYYFDASALVKYYVTEPGSTWVRHLVEDRDSETEWVHTIFVAEITRVEVAAGLAVIERIGRIRRAQRDREYRRFVSQFVSRYAVIPLVTADLEYAADLTQRTCLASEGYEVSHTGGGNRGGSRAGAVRTDIR